MDVYVEHIVEEVANAARTGSKYAIEESFHVPGAPEFGAQATLPMRQHEARHPAPVPGPGAWRRPKAAGRRHSRLLAGEDADYYSQFAHGIPEWNLRGRITTGEDGHFAIRTIQPSPYQIPTDGATGALMRAANWHAWRPAHLHLRCRRPGTGS